MEEMSRRTFVGAAAMGAAAVALADTVALAAEAPAEEQVDPAFVFELEDPSAYWGQDNVVTPRTSRESAFTNLDPEFADLPFSELADLVNNPTPLEEISDAILPDGTTVPAVYVALRNHVNRIGMGIGSKVTETSWQSLMYLWSEEDALHEIEMPINRYFDAMEYHELSGRPMEECQEILDDLALRNLILRANHSGHWVYHLLPNVNGFWEFNELRAYMSNGGTWDGIDDTPEALAAAHEFNSQGISAPNYDNKEGGNFGMELPCFHTYPIGEDVVEEGELAPYMDWKAIIRSNEKITVSPCQCRLRNRAAGREGVCWGSTYDTDEHPFLTCLSFGELAEYFEETGIGLPITQDEAIAYYEHGLDLGMVPETLSMKDVDIMCMCHGDCCGPLGGFKRMRGIGRANVNMNAYLLKYDKEKCIQCGLCIDRCPMEAIVFDEDGYCLHGNQCVRCGQCVRVCPADARILSYRGDYPEMGRDYPESVEVLAVQRMRRGMIVDFVGGELPE